MPDPVVLWITWQQRPLVSIVFLWRLVNLLLVEQFKECRTSSFMLRLFGNKFRALFKKSSLQLSCTEIYLFLVHFSVAYFKLCWSEKGTFTAMPSLYVKVLFWIMMRVIKIILSTKISQLSSFWHFPDAR